MQLAKAMGEPAAAAAALGLPDDPQAANATTQLKDASAIFGWLGIDVVYPMTRNTGVTDDRASSDAFLIGGGRLRSVPQLGELVCARTWVERVQRLQRVPHVLNP